jgi:hypothetical protein
VDEQCGQHDALLRTADLDRLAVVDQFERTEDAKVERRGADSLRL